MPPWVVFLAVITGVIGLLIGSRKGHPVWGFALGFLLSVIGIIIIAVTAPSPEYRTKEAEARLRAEREAARRLDAEQAGQFSQPMGPRWQRGGKRAAIRAPRTERRAGGVTLTEIWVRTRAGQPKSAAVARKPR